MHQPLKVSCNAYLKDTSSHIINNPMRHVAGHRAAQRLSRQKLADKWMVRDLPPTQMASTKIRLIAIP